jgi:predicted TIM-barrel fold metal-dependent hydrolase
LIDVASRVPVLQTPSGACNCHKHIFDARFPVAAKSRGKEPDASVADYRMLQRRLGLERVVVVQPTSYGKDNRFTLDSIAQLFCSRIWASDVESMCVKIF